MTESLSSLGRRATFPKPDRLLVAAFMRGRFHAEKGRTPFFTLLFSSRANLLQQQSS